MSQAAIEFDQVSKRFPRHRGVHELSLKIPQGTVYGLLGPNGAGKTTTIRLAMNIVTPDCGTVRVLGARPDSEQLAGRIGYLPEERGLYRTMTVRDTLAYLARLRGVPKGVLSSRITYWLERFGLSGEGVDWGSARVDQLSRGMQQKVQFIAAVLHEPELVILDEPFSGLDPVNAQELTNALRDLRHRGCTIVISTHLIGNAERLCDHICVIANGSLRLQGAVAALRRPHASRIAVEFDEPPSAALREQLTLLHGVRTVDLQGSTCFLDMTDIEDIGQLATGFHSLGAPVIRIERVRPSLHQIFLDVVDAHHVEPGMSGHG